MASMVKIFAFNADNDVEGSAFTRCSSAYNFADDDPNNHGGITVDQHGDLLECIYNSTCPVLAQRALLNGIWAENQTMGLYLPPTGGVPTGSTACGVDNSGYFYTGDGSGGSGSVKLYRYKPATDDVNYITLTLDSMTALVDIAFDHKSAEKIFILVTTETNYYLYYATLSDLSATFTSNGTLALGSAPFSNISALTAGGGPYTGIAYDTKNDEIYVVVDHATGSSKKLGKLSGASWVTWSATTFDIPDAAPTGGSYKGLAYNDEKLFLVESNALAADRIYVLPIVRQASDKWYRLHAYAIPFRVAGSTTRIHGIDFDSNKSIVAMNTSYKVFQTIACLENINVMQVNTFIDNANILPSGVITAVTPIQERFFEPSEFFNPLDVPDKYYMIAAYYQSGSPSTFGFIIMHLGAFLTDVNGAGNDRFDVQKIRIQKFESASGGTAYTNCNLVGPYVAAQYINGIAADKDIIFWTLSGTEALFMLDMKAGKAYVFGDSSTYGGRPYDGTISDRNKSYGYDASTALGLTVTGQPTGMIKARTFNRNDVSDYNSMYPETEVVFGCNSNFNLLSIHWDNLGNRMPQRMLLALCSASMGDVVNWLPPSGYLIYGDVANRVLYKSNIPIWEINTTGQLVAGTSAVTTLATVGTTDEQFSYIAENSPCFKAANMWEHRPFVFGDDTNGSIFIADDSSTVAEKIYSAAAASGAFVSGEVLEDKIIAPGHGTVAKVQIIKKQTFRQQLTGFEQQWTPFETVSALTQPRFLFLESSTNNLVVSVSPMFGICAAYASSYSGLQLLHYGQQQNRCQHESIYFDCENPKYYYYRAAIKDDGGEQVRITI